MMTQSRMTLSRSWTKLPALLVLAACSRGNDRAIADPAATSKPTSTSTSTSTSTPTSTSTSTSTLGVVPREEIDPRFVDDLKKVAEAHRAWGRVDDETRWAPMLCRTPEPGKAHMSGADAGGHARKLYSLFAIDRNAYLAATVKGVSAEGQAIVKESYLPEPVPDARATELRGRSTRGLPAPEGVAGGGAFDPYAWDGDKLYLASKVFGLFVMMKKAPTTPGTDAGWIYGTLTPEGEVTSAGRVASCMGCHSASKHDRLLR